MNYLKYEVDAGPQDVIVVNLDRAANVRLFDAPNYANYRRGRAHHYIGGLAKVSPLRLRPPSTGRWYVVIDLGGYAGRVSANVQVLHAA